MIQYLTQALSSFFPIAIFGPSVVGVAGGSFHLLFAALLWVQTRRVRLICEEDGFEFYNIKGNKLDLDKGAYLEEKPANFENGTRNRWNYDQISTYDFFPSIAFPLLIYFKETQTAPENRGKRITSLDPTKNGQPHFFPGLVDARAFKMQMEKHGVKQTHKVLRKSA